MSDERVVEGGADQALRDGEEIPARILEAHLDTLVILSVRLTGPEAWKCERQKAPDLGGDRLEPRGIH